MRTAMIVAALLCATVCAADDRVWLDELDLAEMSTGENKAGYSAGQKVELKFPLETCDTMSNGAWGYQVGVTDYKSVDELRGLLKSANEKGANLLLNIGPQPDGRLPAYAIDRLERMVK